jgi:hypothetical protein
VQTQNFEPSAGAPSSRLIGLTSLLVANGLTIYFFATGHGSLMEVLWIYWFQSIVIGVINFIRILSLPSVISITLPGGIPATREVPQLPTAIFFSFSYGFYHLVYMVFLIIFSQSQTKIIVNGVPKTFHFNAQGITWSAVFLATLAFAFHHAYTFWVERRTLHSEGQSIIAVASPYARIMPMHLIIIFMPFIYELTNDSRIVLVSFMGLKTLADVMLHLKSTSHHMTAQAAPIVPQT